MSGFTKEKAKLTCRRSASIHPSRNLQKPSQKQKDSKTGDLDEFDPQRIEATSATEVGTNWEVKGSFLTHSCPESRFQPWAQGIQGAF